ncbi:MAG: type II toxin-antitoxin system RelB/DinJ family antitoxin [Alphaproteobacteria bacterium]|nr:MAG: type II toxin-antitoxin system RelB/DinJ family antitoxin [Alphaproteobacteria bacterium]
MASDTVVRARIDGQVKEKAAKVLADMGLSVSDAIRLLLVRVATEKALPFEIKVPNAETGAAVKAMTRYRDLDERLVAVLELWSATARCPPAIATTPYREIGRATGTVISGPTSC